MKISPRKQVEGSLPFVGSHVWDLDRESPRDDLESVGLLMVWLLLEGNLPWIDADPREIQI